MRTWDGGVFVEPEQALTGTARRCKILPRVCCDALPKVETKEEKRLGPSVTFQRAIRIGTTPPFPTNNSSSKNVRCVYNYNDKFQFRRILLATDLSFDSHFESGNLFSAHRREIDSTSFAEYDLILHHDVHSAGHIQWFNFSVSNTIAGMSVKFHIGNFTKKGSLFDNGMKPLFFSKIKGNFWTRTGGSEISYLPSQKLKKKIIYTLTFTHVFEHNGDTCAFAACYPYTYSYLLEYLTKCQIDKKRNVYFRRKLLCKTLGGNRCDLLTITEPTAKLHELKKRLGVVISARVHPGETCSSWICHGIIEYLTGPCIEAKKLRKQYVFKIVPMLNPDGVVNGNYRTSLAGVDLNRRWDNPDSSYHPTVFKTKEMIKIFQTKLEVVTLCDIHGHSRKQGLFMYGCGLESRRNNIRSYITTYTFPKLFDKNCEFFNLPGCTFKMQGCKSSTMRMVMYKEFGITNSYTLEASLSGGQDDCHFDCHDLQKIGHDYSKTLLHFFDIISGTVKDNIVSKELMILNQYSVHSKICLSLSGNVSDESVGSDSNPSEDNLSEGEIVTLLSRHECVGRNDKKRKIEKRKVKKKEKEKRNKPNKE